MSADSSDTKRARELNSKGVHAWRQGKVDKAERHYRDALIADVNFGPAHNNLGHLYLGQQQFYLAAWEFELAANAMPGRIEPIINLGLVYEHVHRDQQAEVYYRRAFDMNTRSADAISHLVRLLVRAEADKFEINFLLHELLLYDSRSSWRAWAEELLATRFRDEDCCQVDVIADASSSIGENLQAPQPSSPRLPPELLPSPNSPEPDPPKFLDPAIDPRKDEETQNLQSRSFGSETLPSKAGSRAPFPDELSPSTSPSQ
jgi:tetratricopeptide (TPR) repeat protein